jgi:hypothetical protein
VYKIEANSEAPPEMTPEQMKEHCDQHMLNGIGYAIAQSGYKKTCELAALLGCSIDKTDTTLRVVQSIVMQFHAMDIELNLTHDHILEVDVRINMKNLLNVPRTIQ